MDLTTQEFTVPDFVQANSSKLDINAPGALVVEGLRIDNPAAAWVASAELRKSASGSFSNYAMNMIKEACSLFNITDDMFTINQPNFTSNVTITRGDNSASFAVFDDESLNKAASGLLDNRSNIDYEFARDCALALSDIATKSGFKFDEKTSTGVKKLAGELNVDFEKGRKVIESRVSMAKSLGMKEHAETLSKIASLCTKDCSPVLAPYFISAVDEFDRGVEDKIGQRKEASEFKDFPENYFYLSATEDIQKRASESFNLGYDHSITRGEVRNALCNGLDKWASEFGYNISEYDTPEEAIAVLREMPESIQKAFLDNFSK